MAVSAGMTMCCTVNGDCKYRYFDPWPMIVASRDTREARRFPSHDAKFPTKFFFVVKARGSYRG